MPENTPQSGDKRFKSSAHRRTSTAGRDVFAPLHVIKQLKVGPLRLERDRLTAPYTVTGKGGPETTELSYRFEEPIFDPSDPEAANLASMMAAQVALNYGLFCDEIVFRLPLDEHDCRFLTEMARNTAREIYVKKFLQPNPFLQGDAAKLPVVRQNDYLHARLVFDDEPKSADRRSTWSVDRNRHLILSSGGKDSLLGYGLLREIGRETHPVFVNESGRHWFTALNAYRHFAEHEPNTGRVWTNADRVFAWMLRRIPFIRQDFQNIRSDDYPIRLWTVAVFLFGVLPIVRKRGIGRIVIGDEFDTSERASHEGITHYSGLYDQSRYFDNALSRYFARKGWGVTQFSILRPMSDLLIQKTLARRYPELLALQVSCHAAHKDGDRIRPCGQCEKCRRIVGMLMAVDGDPADCGYSPEQARKCIEDLATKDIHVERQGAEQLAFLLASKGLLPSGSVGPAIAREHPATVKLRFDRERSPVDWIPVDLRQPLFQILLEYTNGAVQRVGRVWVDFDPLGAEALSQPYAFEKTGGRMGGESMPNKPAGRTGSDHLLGRLTWPEAQARFKKVDVALLPVGAIEQHGPHLPLDTDAFDAEYLAGKVAEACSDPKPFVLPLIPYGVSYHHENFAGTISIQNETLAKFVYDIGMGVARNGITKLVIINGHGGNAATLHFAAQMINRKTRIFTCVDTGETSDTDVNRIAETDNDVHAGEIETSTSLAVRPELVRMDKAARAVPRFSSRYLEFSSKRSVDWYARTEKISKSGVMGDPTKATREKGERMWEVMIKNLVEFVEDLKSMSLDEIHQRLRF